MVRQVPAVSAGEWGLLASYALAVGLVVIALPILANPVASDRAMSGPLSQPSGDTTFTIVFNETGLPSGSTWTVALYFFPPNHSGPSTTTTHTGVGILRVSGLGPGMYVFFASSSGYTASPYPGGVILPFAGLSSDNETIAFQPAPPPAPTFLGMPMAQAQGYVGGTVTAALIAATCVFLWRRSATPPTSPP